MNRGSVFDIPVIIIIMFGLAITIVFGYVILANLAVTLDDISVVPTLAKDAVDQIMDYFKIFDFGFAILFFSLIVSTVLLARNIPTHPVFFILSALGMVIVMIFAYAIKSIYEGIVTSPEIATYAQAFPIMNGVMLNLAWFALAIFIIISLAMYGGAGEKIATI